MNDVLTKTIVKNIHNVGETPSAHSTLIVGVTFLMNRSIAVFL